jgi:hypothetical protein
MYGTSFGAKELALGRTIYVRNVPSEQDRVIQQEAKKKRRTVADQYRQVIEDWISLKQRGLVPN